MAFEETSILIRRSYREEVKLLDPTLFVVNVEIDPEVNPEVNPKFIPKLFPKLSEVNWRVIRRKSRR